MRERVTVLSLSVSQSFCYTTANLEDGCLSKIERVIKMLYWTIEVPLICQSFLFFFVSAYFFRKSQLLFFLSYDHKLLLVTLPIVTSKSHEQIASCNPWQSCFIFSVFYRCAGIGVSFPLKLLEVVGVSCIFSFSYKRQH